MIIIQNGIAIISADSCHTGLLHEVFLYIRSNAIIFQNYTNSKYGKMRKTITARCLGAMTTV